MSGEQNEPALYGVIQPQLQEEVAKLKDMATAVAEQFWDTHFWHRNHSRKELWGSYGVRIRERANTVSIDWYRMVFYGPPGNRQVTHNHLKRGDGPRYKRSTFKQAQPWEIEAIMVAEEQFARIRRATDRLVAISQQARYYDATLQALQDKEPDDTQSA